MKIESLKDLEKVIKLCRKNGIETFKIDGIEFKLGSLPVEDRQTASPTYMPGDIGVTYTPGGVTADTKIVTEELSDEQMLFWSAAAGGQQSGEAPN